MREPCLTEQSHPDTVILCGERSLILPFSFQITALQVLYVNTNSFWVPLVCLEINCIYKKSLLLKHVGWNIQVTQGNNIESTDYLKFASTLVILFSRHQLAAIMGALLKPSFAFKMFCTKETTFYVFVITLGYRILCLAEHIFLPPVM